MHNSAQSGSLDIAAFVAIRDRCGDLLPWRMALADHRNWVLVNTGSGDLASL